ncbi:MAG: hypothetical protein MAG794_01536 [Gammaproteobacteria bacterium]|nr:hypothetical protein [Gammaproteobacteria bacterium]
MWFKREKKTEQDHALSESLRSLQNLLNETDRREPRLDTEHPQSDSDVPDDSESTLDEAVRTEELSARVPENPAAPESGNRWRNLNLSFDADPVITRGNHSSDVDAKNLSRTTPDDGAGPGEHAAGDSNSEEFESPPPDLPLENVEASASDIGESGSHLKDTESRGTANDERDNDSEGRTTPMTDAETEVVKTSTPYKERHENQLQLELESAEESWDGIPTLTDAVYVPDTASEDPQPSEPTDTPRGDSSPIDSTDTPDNENIDRCIENLRTRLQSTGLGALSPGQEKELHNTLVEFFDPRGHS